MFWIVLGYMEFGCAGEGSVGEPPRSTGATAEAHTAAGAVEIMSILSIFHRHLE